MTVTREIGEEEVEIEVDLSYRPISRYSRMYFSDENYEIDATVDGKDFELTKTEWETAWMLCEDAFVTEIEYRAECRAEELRELRRDSDYINDFNQRFKG